jgi:hypothetical protein
MFVGENEPYGAMLTYYVNPELASEVEKKKCSKSEKKKKKKGDVTIQIYDTDSTLIRKFYGTAKKGINRVYWNLKSDGFKYPRWEGKISEWYTPPGPEVVPGEYLVELSLLDKSALTRVTVKMDPRENIPLENRKANYQVMKSIGKELELAHEAVDKMKKMYDAVEDLNKKLTAEKDTTFQCLIKDGKQLKKKIEETARLFVSVPDKRQGIIRDENLMTTYWRVSSSVASTFDKPTENSKDLHRYAKIELANALEKYNHLFAHEVAAYKEKVNKTEIPVFPEYNELKLE